MVDFNNEGTITTPPGDIIKMLVIEKRYNIIEAMEKYTLTDFRGSTPDTAVVRSRIYSLWLELQASLKKNLTDKEYTKLKEQVEDDEYEEVEQAFIFINEWLYMKNLVKLDTKKQYDSARTELENRAKKL